MIDDTKKSNCFSPFLQTQLSYRKTTTLSTAISGYRSAPAFISRAFDRPISFRYPAGENNNI
jgi:hypothetical protein